VQLGHGGYHAGHHYVVPHYSRHYHGSYWVDSGVHYYQPRTYTASRSVRARTKPIVLELGGFAQVDELSGRLSEMMNELCLDMHYNYSHNAGFKEIYREAHSMIDGFQSIPTEEDQGAREEIARQVLELDERFHYVQGEVRGWNRKHRRQIGKSGVMTKTDAIEVVLHHLMHDVGNDLSPEEVAPPQDPFEVAPPPSTVP